MTDIKDAMIVTEMTLTDVLNDWFNTNQWGSVWNGGPATPDRWVMYEKAKWVDPSDLVVRFIKKPKAE